MRSPLLWYGNRIGLALLCLLTSLVLSGCNSLPQRPDRAVGSPDAYTVPTAEPKIVPADVQGRLTNGELAQAILDLRKALASCNADKASTAEYNQSITKE
jgi:hypothetical protein